MSNYGVFEASSTDGHEEEQRQRKAKRNLGTAIEAAREGFGDFLGSSTDKQDYQDRLALVMNDLMQKVADAGVMPVPGVMRKVKAALRPEFRVAKDLSGLSDEELAKQYSSADYFSDEAEDLANELNSRGLTTTDVTRLLRSRKVAGDLDDFESWVSEEANSVYDSASASRYLSTFPSGEEPFNNDPDALLYAYENQFAEASRKQAAAPTSAQILTKNGWETVPFYRFVQFEFDSGTVVVEVELNGRVQQIELPRQQFKLISSSRKRSRRVQANDYGPDTYPTAMDAFQAWLVDEGLTDAEGPVLMTFQDRHGEGWSDDDLDIDLSLVDKGNAFTSTRKQASGWYQEYDGSWSITLPGDVVGWLRPTNDPELPDTFTVSAEIDNEENGRELFTEFGIPEAEGKRMVEEAAAKVIASRRKAGLSDWFIDGTDFAQMSYDGMPDGNFAFLNVYLHGDGYYMWSVDVENGQANHGKLNATDLESAIAEAEPLISAELGLDPFMYSTRKQAAETFQPGDKVMKSGYPGTVQNEYMDGMYEVRMERGTVVVPAEELTRASSRKQASAYLPVVSVEQNTDDSYMAEISGGFAFEAYDEGGAWVWSIFDNSGYEEASGEASSLDAAKDAAAYALDRVASRKQAFTQENLGNGYYGIFYSAPSGKTDVDILDSGDSLLTELTADSPEMARKQAVEYVNSISSPEFTSSRKQAGSAQVLQKLEDALNDQRSVDVICSNSPDGSFSGGREIPVDEGLQKVRGWVSAGDLVDTAQDGGNFFDFEHRASGENVNFYITQEY